MRPSTRSRKTKPGGGLRAAPRAPKAPSWPLAPQTSSWPEFWGLFSPPEALCQGSCVRAKGGEPVLTGALEAFATAYQRDHADVKIPRGEPSGKRVAVIGAGPAGLACAEQLITRGHAGTFFEAAPAPGGLLTYATPHFQP